MLYFFFKMSFLELTGVLWMSLIGVASCVLA